MGLYIQRSLESVFLKACGEFPAVVLVGPRQSGKTTLLRHLLASTHRYVSLEAPDVRAAALSDPRGFLARFAPPVIFDEVQYAPELLPYIKERIDEDRSATGRFILTGSQNLLMHEKISESLAGRVAILRLLPLAHHEIAGNLNPILPWENPQTPTTQNAQQKLWDSFLLGGYPELQQNPNRDTALWFSSYVQTYLERDVRSLRQVGDLTLFRNFLRLLASRSGQLLDLSDIARDLGLAVNTVKQWLSVLEATFQVVIIRPWYNNIGKRLVKSPKVYYSDTGILCHLVGLKDPEHAEAGPLSGAILETAVITEIFKIFLNRGEEPRLYFWRTSTGAEVDLLVETKNKIIPIEIKQAATPRPEMAKHIKTFQADYGDGVGPGYVLYQGDICLPLAPNISAWPISALS